MVGALSLGLGAWIYRFRRFKPVLGGSLDLVSLLSNLRNRPYNRGLLGIVGRLLSQMII